MHQAVACWNQARELVGTVGSCGGQTEMERLRRHHLRAYGKDYTPARAMTALWLSAVRSIAPEAWGSVGTRALPEVRCVGRP